MAAQLISICIPAYNRPQGLERLLHSIQAQTFTNYEIIITDDSPNDSVTTLVANWQASLPITYYKNAVPLGSPANWNKAISLAQGTWIKLMHDDDWFAANDSLQQFANATEEGNDFIFSGNNNIYLTENRTVTEQLSAKDNAMLQSDYLLLFYRNVIGHPSNTLYKKNALSYDSSIKWVVDIDFYMQYMAVAKHFTYIDALLINTGIDNSTVSNTSYKNPKVEIPEYLYLLQKMGNHLLLQNQHVFAAIWTLVKKFKMQNTAYIHENGFTGTIADGITQIIAAQKKIPRLLLKQTPISNYFMIQCFNRYKTT